MPKAHSQASRKRLQFDFTERMLETLGDCREKLGAASQNEVVRRSLRLMQACLDEKLYVEGRDGTLRRIKVF